MPTMITVTSDDQKDADIIAIEIANHMAGRGFKNVHYHTTEEDGHIFNYAQEQLQAAHDASVEDSPSLLDLMRLSRPEFFEEEDIEVRSEPSVFGDIADDVAKGAPVRVLERANRLVANELVLDDEPDPTIAAMKKVMSKNFPNADIKWYTKPGDGVRSLDEMYGDQKKEIDITEQTV